MGKENWKQKRCEKYMKKNYLKENAKKYGRRWPYSCRDKKVSLIPTHLEHELFSKENSQRHKAVGMAHAQPFERVHLRYSSISSISNHIPYRLW